ncbi:MAG: DUF3619 family protein [Betaproteobacteria bacterium]|nr:DUF3619 family protein [Betaproteobacteria bacterium]
MNEHEVGARVAQYLDDTVADLDPRILRRLQTARESAVVRAREREAAGRIGWSSGGAHLSGHSRFGAAKILVPATALLVALVGIYVWQESMFPPETEELELLADELPLNAYLDKGFHQWISASLQD